MKNISRTRAGNHPACIVLVAFAACMIHSHASQVLLFEAESFDTIGGWQVDTQSVEQMGSVYLIAHGLGKPVADAQRTAALPAAGDYRVWVRTRNWVPGSWQAPGRFKVAINGNLLAPEFGTENGEWHWQDGGTVSLGGPTVEITLKDLTGFNGRCDAIALIAGSDDPPPGEAEALKVWRRTVKNEAASPPDVRRFDCVIAGGGIAGCCAAIAAARSGLQVALIQDRPVLGGNASQEIRVATRGEIRHPIVDEIDTRPFSNRDDRTIGADDDRLAVVSREPNITLFMPWRAEDAGTDPATGRITHIDARHTLSDQRVRLEADYFIDCTGDAWIGYWAGASYRMGWEAKSEFGESLGKHTADAMTMGNSLMWKTGTGTTDSTFPAVPWAMDVAGTRADTGGDWNWEYGMTKDTIADAEHIRDHLLRAIFGNFSNAKKDSSNTKLELNWVPFIAGKRESRRLIGDHILTQNDLVNGVFFEDAVGTTDWGIDLHYETSVSYLSSYHNTSIAKPCYFPFRSLYSRDVPNLLMAGRNFSCTHAGLGSPRVMNTTGQMGVAVGYATAICKQYGITPRDLYRSRERTTELQARITGTWPALPSAVGHTMDNSDATGVHIQGTWTAGASLPGYIGADYLNAAASTPGTHRIAYTPPLLMPGRYEVALRWPQHTSHNPQTPVWVFNTAPVQQDAGSAELQAIRITHPNEPQTVGSIEVGRYAANDYQRGLLRFDLTTLPAGAVVHSAEVILTSPGADSESGTGFAGAGGLRLELLGEAYVHGQASWTRRDTAASWATPGGTIDTGAGAMGVLIDLLTDPNLVAPGETFTLGSAALGSAVQRARLQGGPLHLVLRTPTLESSYAVRKIYRFSSAVLRVSCWLPQLPATLTVDQRANGSQWTSIGSHLVGEHGITVVIGNDGPGGTYSVADGVAFTPAGGDSDRDGDGLPDWWERWYFLSETAASPAADSDGDSHSNHLEYLTGCNPTDPSSFFNAQLALDAQSGGCLLHWPSAEGIRYRIEASTDCKNWEPIAQHIPATPPRNQYQAPIVGERRFFRVVVDN